MADTGEPSPPAKAEAVEPRATLQPKLRLFLSADVVGSTAYKQRSEADTKRTGADTSGGDHWFLMVSSFYRQAVAILQTQWGWFESNLSEDSQDEMLGAVPTLWKTIGDEVLFAKEIKSPSQAVMTIQVWMTVLKELQKGLKKFHSSLDVKSTAWIADFPIRNREIILGGKAEQDDDLDWTNDWLMQQFYQDVPGLICDYIGPSIDTGFRLGSAATPRQLAISVELAHMLSYEECQPREKYRIGPAEIPMLCFRYDGRQPLKGVLNGASYPHIWIDTDPDGALNKTEDALLARAAPGCQGIHDFTTAFIDEHATKFCTDLPFTSPKRPDAYLAHCASMGDEIRKRELLFRKIEETQKARQTSIASPEGAEPSDVKDVSLRLVDEVAADQTTT